MPEYRFTVAARNGTEYQEIMGFGEGAHWVDARRMAIRIGTDGFHANFPDNFELYLPPHSIDSVRYERLAAH